jgi:Glycosyl hydrolase family 63 C-terminal domain
MGFARALDDSPRGQQRRLGGAQRRAAAEGPMTAEEQRIQENYERKVNWTRWGPYLSERQWGTVREDYSANGDAWNYLPYDHSRSRAYRWGEDGIAGLCDKHQRICFALTLWNERDPILKERLFGLTNTQGNHGEDVKEYYFYLDATPTSSYLKYLYKYPQSEFPYEQLLTENAKRTRKDPEFELMDTGIFNENRYFDVFIEYAKSAVEVIPIRITVFNRGPETARLRLLPTIWFRNKWSWGSIGPGDVRPELKRLAGFNGFEAIELQQPDYGKRWLAIEGQPELLFTENETNNVRLFNSPNSTRYVKDAIDNYVVHGAKDVVNPAQTGTKAAAHFKFEIPAGGSATVRLLLTDQALSAGATAAQIFAESAFDSIFDQRKKEADEFYARLERPGISADAINVQRQALAGLLWNKQSYHYDVSRWLDGDPGHPPPPPQRLFGRNHEWRNLYNSDVISMPDKWEYPWYASWDLGFHCVSLAMIDSDFAKEQLILFLREWYMQPNGQIPAYEWEFSNANPPVHAGAALRVYAIERRMRGKGDRNFLERVFHKLLLNFTWWVNRKDPRGLNVFEGGFLGLDNIGVFDRSQPLPGGGHIEQSDGTSWMMVYSLSMMAMALELAKEDPAYEDVASKFFEHCVHISDAMNKMGGEEMGLWDEEDGFYYDVLHMPDGTHLKMKVRSMVGLIPLFAVQTVEPEELEVCQGFQRRMKWFLEHHPDLRTHMDDSKRSDKGVRRLIALVNKERLPRILRYMLDENEFLSPYGIRSLSKVHAAHPYSIELDDMEHSVAYEPAESSSDLFGGNSNWRGPVWIPMNFLIIEALQRYDYYYGKDLKVECPTGSGKYMTLWEVAAEISRRVSRLFLRRDGRRAIYGGTDKFQDDPYWRDLILFYEYFNGDNGAGLGASHQTGWTALVAKLIQQSGE